MTRSSTQRNAVQAPAPRSGKTLGDDDVRTYVCLSVCPSVYLSVPVAQSLVRNYQTNQRENLGQFWGHEYRLSDAAL